MSPITGLSRLPGHILFSLHIGNFNPVNRDDIQESIPKWWNIKLILHAVFLYTRYIYFHTYILNFETKLFSEC